MRNEFLTLGFTAAVLTLLLVGCAVDRDQATGDEEAVDTTTATTADRAAGDQMTIAEFINQHDRLETMDRLTQQTGLDIMLDEGQTSFTVFAPTDEAFNVLEQATLQSLMDPDNEELLRHLVTAHIVEGAYPPSLLQQQEGLIATGEEELNVEMRNDSLYVNGALITGAHVQVDNGVVYIIDAALLPLENALRSS